MEEFFKEIIQFLIPQNNLFLYLFLFLSAIMENLFPPIPGDTITAFGAFLVGTGRLNYLLVYFSTTLGSVLGFMLLFYLGRFLGKEFFIKKNIKFLDEKKLYKAEIKFQKFGYLIVLLNRFFPGIRSVISISSGILKLKSHLVWIFALISAAVWNIIWIHAGFLLGNNWKSVERGIKSLITKYNLFAGIILTLMLITYIGYSVYKKKRNSNT